ncbi:hypothetical protein PAMA_008731 [Pampus argenteus]
MYKLLHFLSHGSAVGLFDLGNMFLSVNMLADVVLLSVFFVTGASAACRSNLRITTPQKMEALSGSCLLIPCTFIPIKGESEFDSSRTVVGLWIKSGSNFKTYPENVIFSSSQTVNTYPMNIIGNLSQKNCTTLFSSLITAYTDTYYFRIENDPFLATAVCDPPEIQVIDSPWSPRIEISGELKEKESVNITCSALTPCPHFPPELTWNLQQNAPNRIEGNQTFTTQIQTTITLSDTHDGENITCSARYPVNEGNDSKTAEAEVTLSVSYAPKNTSAMVSPSGPVSPGSWVNLTCSSRAKPAANFTWFEISKDGPMKVSEGAFYTFNVTEGGVYFCVATNALGNETSTRIHLTMEEQEMPGSFQQVVLLGGLIGSVVFTGLLVCVCCLVSLRCFRSTNASPQQTQSQTGENPASKTEEANGQKEGEDLHYGEIDFSKLGLEASSDPVQVDRQQQGTVYAQVNVSKPTNSSTQTADRPEDLYAQVKKK